MKWSTARQIMSSLAILVLAGCSGVAAPGASATVVPGASRIPVTVSPTPPARSTAACLLPVTWGRPDALAGGGADSGPLGGGFVSFPDGGFRSDPGAHATTPFGSSGLWHDRASSGWLPVPQRLVSLDGSTYIYFTLRQAVEVHAVSVATGGDTVLAPHQEQFWNPVGLDNHFAYAMVGSGSQASDLWRIPFNGAPASQVTTGGYWIAITAGSAWGTDSQSPPTGAPFALKRLDLISGQSSPWAEFSGGARLLGFDAVGSPVIADGTGDVVVMPSPNVKQPLGTGLVLQPRSAHNDYAPTIAFGDAHGIWLAGADGIYLSVDGSTTKISNVRAFPAGTCG